MFSRLYYGSPSQYDGQKGDNFTIELGHLLDRVVLGALKRRGHTTDEPLTLAFWLTTLSLARSTPAVERIQMPYEVL